MAQIKSERFLDRGSGASAVLGIFWKSVWPSDSCKHRGFKVEHRFRNVAALDLLEA